MSNDPAPEAGPAVKPQVIDLDAVEVNADDEASRSPAADETPDAPPPSRSRKRGAGWVWPALLLTMGAIIGGWLYRDILSAYLPNNAMTAMSNRIGAMEVANKALGDSLAALKQADEKRNADLDTALGDAVTAARDAKAATLKIEPRLAALEKDAATARTVIEQLQTGALTVPSGTADPAALTALSQRLDALEKDVTALKANGVASADTAQISALRQSLSDLMAKIAAGSPYRDDLDRVIRMVPAAGGNDVLASYADGGLPNAQGLAAELRTASSTLPKPQEPAGDGGYVSSFWNAVTSVVTIRDVGDSDWPALADSAAKLAEQNELPQAVAALDAAQGKTPDALARWRDRAISRIKLDAAAADFAKSVGLAIAAMGGGQ